MGYWFMLGVSELCSVGCRFCKADEIPWGVERSLFVYFLFSVCVFCVESVLFSTYMPIDLWRSLWKRHCSGLRYCCEVSGSLIVHPWHFWSGDMSFSCT